MVRLSESIVYSRTKIAVEFVRKLNLWGCDIDNIDLCSQMVNLQILSLSMNRVKFLKPLENCARLEELYLRKNEISSLSELEHLKDLKLLRILWIDENPCTADNKHRPKVLQILPTLTRLDDKPVTVEELLSVKSSRQNNTDHVEARTIVDRIIPNSPLVLELMPSHSVHSLERVQQQSSRLLFTSMYEGTAETEQNDEQNSWQDFSLEMSSSCEPDPTMFHSLYDEPICSRQPRNPQLPQQRSVSLPRSTLHAPSQRRKARVISAIGVLLDELDADGLREIVDEAQRRIKKLR